MRPWAQAGYSCFCFDNQHAATRIEKIGLGQITYVRADLTPGGSNWAAIRAVFGPQRIAFIFGFPPCTDLAASGALHWAYKEQQDRFFQEKAAAMAIEVGKFADEVKAPYVIENPKGALTRLWRQWDYSQDPCDFGGYLPENDVHPTWPKYIAPRDAYTKETHFWCGNGFVLPALKRVTPEVLVRITASGRTLRGSRQFMKLGGSSMKTKNIRNETPRGFALAVFVANALLLAGCAHSICDDNPRNMQCMTGDQLTKELGG